MTPISLIALDLDGTLLNSNLQISRSNQQAICTAINNGMEVIISTGRPYSRIPIDLLATLGVKYAITANGAAVYKLPEKECIYADTLSLDTFLPIAQKLIRYDILFFAFTDGFAYSQANQYAVIEKMRETETYKTFLRKAAAPVPDIVAHLKEQALPVQKGSVNFYALKDGTYKDRKEVLAYLKSNPDLTCVNGGGINLEFTKAGVSKARGLAFLADYLSISMRQTMAIGDSENDLDIITAAGVGVAMANAAPQVKSMADYVTLTNDEDGVHHAFRKFNIIKDDDFAPKF